MKKRRELLIEKNDEVYYRIEKFVEEVTDDYLLHDTYFGNILIALTEAVQNAIIHGNKADASKKVMVSLEQKKDGLWLTVADQGDGFDYDRAMASESLFEPGEKKGLALIKGVTDEVRFKNRGRVIEMLFRIYGIDESIFDRRQDLMTEFLRKTQIQPH